MSDVVRFRPVRRFRPAPMRPARRALPLRWLPLGLVAVALVAMLATPKRNANAPLAATAIALCRTAAEPTCVIDGDTIRYNGIKIRLADIDAPEVFSPQCASERALGERAALRLVALMNEGPVQMARDGGRDEDVYGRKLRTLWRDGRSLGDTLVAEGLARRWDGARRGWCG
jgi:endonuclease YncB( thermonuclease family)